MRYSQQFRHKPILTSSLWSFSITGAVRHPLIWNWEDIQAYPPAEVAAVLLCAHQPEKSPDPALIYDAVWTGIPLTTLLDELTLDADVTGATLYAADGYTSNLTLEQLRAASLVYAIDGQPLPVEHGFPARIIAPGLVGYKSPKWIERVHLAVDPTPGLWESRGWNSTELRPTLAFDDPREDQHSPIGEPFALSGVALTTDPIVVSLHRPGVRHALPISIQPSAAGNLTHWRATWTPDIPGDFVIYACAGETQIQKTVRIR